MAKQRTPPEKDIFQAYRELLEEFDAHTEQQALLRKELDTLRKEFIAFRLGYRRSR